MVFRQLVITLGFIQLIFTVAIWAVIARSPRAAPEAPPVAEELRVVDIAGSDFAALANRPDGALASLLGLGASDRIVSLDAAGPNGIPADTLAGSSYLDLRIERDGRPVRILVLPHAAIPAPAALPAPL
jgi:hypothetical protein